jgi:hypothetical protein
LHGLCDLTGVLNTRDPVFEFLKVGHLALSP